MKKKIRIANVLFWTAVTITLSCAAALDWTEQGCNVISVLVGVAWFACTFVGFAFIIDSAIKDHK